MHLKKRHKTYWAVHVLPRDVRPLFGGKERLAVSLATHDLEEAKRIAPIYEARWRADIARARAVAGDDLARLAEPYRRAFVTAGSDEERGAIRSLVRDFAEEEITRNEAAKRRIHGDDDPRFHSPEVQAEAKRFEDIVTGKTIPFAAEVDAYLVLCDVEEKSRFMRGAAIRKFGERFKFTSDVNKKAVQTWVDGMVREGKAVATIRKNLSELRGYWKHLQAHELVPADLEPFERLNLPKVKAARSDADTRQPFPAEDMPKIHAAAMAGKGDQQLADLIALAAFTGARIEELCTLTLDKVTGKALTIADAKSAAGRRTIPIHPAALPVIARLRGDRTEGWLFEGLKANKFGDRSAMIGKRFGRLKTKLGYGEQHVFHSIRKTVSTVLENAGVPENVAADILGHDKPTMTYGLYSGGSNLLVMAEAIQKIVYPGWEPLT